MTCICLTKDDKYIFTGDYIDGQLKQWSIAEQALYKDYGKVIDFSDKDDQLERRRDSRYDRRAIYFIAMFQANCSSVVNMGVSKLYITINTFLSAVQTVLWPSTTYKKKEK